MLSGVNPTVITRCRELPEEFVKDEERIFGDKETCAKELEVSEKMSKKTFYFSRKRIDVRIDVIVFRKTKTKSLTKQKEELKSTKLNVVIYRQNTFIG